MNARLAAALQWAKRNAPLTAAGGALLTALVAAPFLIELRAGKVDARFKQMALVNAQMRKSLDETNQKYKALEADRDNILLQTKGLLQEKAKWSDAAEEMDALKKSNAVITGQKDKLLAEMQKSKSDLETISGHFGRLKTAYQDLLAKHGASETENGQLRQALGRKVEEAPQYVALNKETKGLRSDKGRLEATVSTLEAKLKAATDRIRKIQDRDKKFAKQIDGDRKAIAELKAEKERLTRVNGEMNKLAAEAPARFKGIAEENRRLVKETAEMHYNMGVFFLEKRNLAMAEKELKRAIDLDPNNAKAHYNLGYLYSEELDKHDLAIFHFNRFLEIRPNSKESEVVRSYLMMRKTYGDSAPRR